MDELLLKVSKPFDVNNKKYVSFKVSYPREEVIDTFDIDSNGTFMTPDVLEPGKYILYEVIAICVLAEPLH